MPSRMRFAPAEIRRVVAYRGPIGAGARDGEGRVEREAGLDSGIRLVKSIKLREGGSRREMPKRIISVGLERPSTPCDRLLPTAELELRNSRASHPEVSHRIARTEAQGLDRMSFGFFGVTDENLTKSDAGMCVCEISIQRQRIFTFGDAFPRAPGSHVDKSQQLMAAGHGLAPTTGLWSISFRPRRTPRWDR